MMTVRLYHQTSKTLSDGTHPVFIILASGSKRKFIATKVNLAKEHFDNRTGRALKGAKNFARLNSWFQKQLDRINEIIIDIESTGREATFELVETKYKNDSDTDFISFAFAELKKEKATIATKTYMGYLDRLNYLKRFRSHIPMHEINHQFLIELRQYFHIQGRKPNGYYQDFATIKKFHRLAVIRGLAKGNPFENFRLEKEETIKAWLTKEDLKALTAILDSDKISAAEANTLRHFLFSCYTGIRFGDKKDFRADNVVDGRIVMVQNKTGKSVTIPFSNQASSLLPHILDRPLKQSSSRVNKDLEQCISVAGIKKSITYHCSRHTFAINCILAGVDLITVRDWLGHASVTTTEIYAKIAAQYKDQSMNKLAAFLD